MVRNGYRLEWEHHPPGNHFVKTHLRSRKVERNTLEAYIQDVLSVGVAVSVQQKPADSLTKVGISRGLIRHRGGKSVPSEEDIPLNLDSPSSEDEFFSISEALYRVFG